MSAHVARDGPRTSPYHFFFLSRKEIWIWEHSKSLSFGPDTDLIHHVPSISGAFPNLARPRVCNEQIIIRSKKVPTLQSLPFFFSTPLQKIYAPLCIRPSRWHRVIFTLFRGLKDAIPAGLTSIKRKTGELSRGWRGGARSHAFE